jgi:hypothetical protein
MSIAINFYMPNLSDEGLQYLGKIAGCFQELGAEPEQVIHPSERGKKPVEQITVGDAVREEIACQNLQFWFQSWVVGALVDRDAKNAGELIEESAPSIDCLFWTDLNLARANNDIWHMEDECNELPDVSAFLREVSRVVSRAIEYRLAPEIAENPECNNAD